MVSAEQFSRKLIETRDNRHAMNHPIIQKWSRGELNRKQMAFYVIQHSKWTPVAAGFFGLLLAKCPHTDVKDSFIENLAEEHGILEEGGRTATPHVEMQYRFIEDCGISREEVQKTPITAGAQSMINNMGYLAYSGPWEIYAAAQFANESQQVGIMSKLVPSLINNYGYREGSREIEFFEEHYLADQEHGQRQLDMLLKYVTDDRLQEECLKAADMITRIRYLFLDELDQIVSEM